MSPSPFFRYRSNLAKRMTSAEDIRLAGHRNRQLRASALLWAGTIGTGLVAAAILWWLFGQDFLFYITTP